MILKHHRRHARPMCLQASGKGGKSRCKAANKMARDPGNTYVCTPNLLQSPAASTGASLAPRALVSRFPRSVQWRLERTVTRCNHSSSSPADRYNLTAESSHNSEFDFRASRITTSPFGRASPASTPKTGARSLSTLREHQSQMWRGGTVNRPSTSVTRRNQTAAHEQGRNFPRRGNATILLRPPEESALSPRLPMCRVFCFHPPSDSNRTLANRAPLMVFLSAGVGAITFRQARAVGPLFPLHFLCSSLRPRLNLIAAIQDVAHESSRVPSICPVLEGQRWNLKPGAAQESQFVHEV